MSKVEVELGCDNIPRTAAKHLDPVKGGTGQANGRPYDWKALWYKSNHNSVISLASVPRWEPRKGKEPDRLP